ncbi:MAG: NOG1 family protein [Halobacteriaceae archaeon]
MIFEDLPTTPTAEELIDQAFSRAARAGRAKQGVEAQKSMLMTASNVLSDNLGNVAQRWPDFRDVDPFYREFGDAVLRRELDIDAEDAEIETPGLDTVVRHLANISWASRTTKRLGREYIGRLPNETDGARKLRKQAFARMADVVEEVEADLHTVGEARNALRDLPEIDAEKPAIVVAGYPNVGKSSFVNAVTRTSSETASYPFTTTGILVGHVERDHITYQIVDTPGMLDRPQAERNAIESQAASAMTHLADAVLFIYDASGSCGYPLSAQRTLHDEVVGRFDVPIVTVCNKADLDRGVEADHYMSVTDGEGVDETLDAAIEAVGYELELPFEG